MRISCPKCGNTGRLPEHLSSGTHAVRCRKCRSRFMTVCVDREELEAEVRSTPGVISAPRALAGVARRDRESIFDSDCDDDSSEIVLGPGDSHYELGPAFEDFYDDSHPDLPVVSPATSSRKTGIAAGLALAGGAEPSFAHLSSNRAHPGWHRPHVLIVIGFGTLSLMLMALFACGLFLGASTGGSVALVLLAGLVITCGVMVIAIATTLVCFLLAELARSLRSVQSASGATAADSRR
jgi:hypothetical protein